MKQFVQVVGAPLGSTLPPPLPPRPLLLPPTLPLFFVPPGLLGREGTVELNPDGGGELGLECVWVFLPGNDGSYGSCEASGVELARGIFIVRLGCNPD